MYFDDKYFKTEEIDGFVVDSMMKRAWAAEMEIMQEIDSMLKRAWVSEIEIMLDID